MLSTSRAPPFTEKWFWFKADPRRTGAYAYASERVHSISFICRIIAVFLFAAQGRANARVHRLKVSLEFVPHSAEVVQLLSDPRPLCSSFLFQFSSFVESEICATTVARSAPRREFLSFPNGIKGGREGSAYLSFSSPLEKKFIKTGEKYRAEREILFPRVFYTFYCISKVGKFLFFRIIFDHIRVEEFSYLSSFLLLLLLLFFSFFKINSSVSIRKVEVNFLVQFLVDKSSIAFIFFFFFFKTYSYI